MGMFLFRFGLRSEQAPYRSAIPHDVGQISKRDENTLVQTLGIFDNGELTNTWRALDRPVFLVLPYTKGNLTLLALSAYPHQ